MEMGFVARAWKYLRGFRIVRRGSEEAEVREAVPGNGRKVRVTVEVEDDG